jgi:hypothetical protein
MRSPTGLMPQARMMAKEAVLPGCAPASITSSLRRVKA